MTGPGETTPTERWNRRLGQAQAWSEAGEYAASTSQLEDVLAEMEGATDSAVLNLRPKILGKLGYNALHQQDYAAALDYTARACDACLTAADEEGLVVYYENLMSLRVIQALQAEPERGQRLLDVRRLIARAQDSADAGRYQASINVLSQALAVIEGHSKDELLRALLPKIHGLRGFDEFKLGNPAKARELSALALKESEAIEDADGVRIYTTNLGAIDGR